MALGANLAVMFAHRSPVREPLLQQPPPVNEHAQPSEQPPSQLVQPESAAPLPSQTGTLKVLALVLLAVAILVGAAALLSNSGVVQPGGPPPECRKSAALTVLRQEHIAAYSNEAAGTDRLQLIIWGGKGKRAELVFDDTHVMNLQDQKWHAVQQAGGFVKQVIIQFPGLRNVWKTAPKQDSLQDLPAELPASRWKQVTSTDRISNSMIMFGGDGVHSEGSNTGNTHTYLNDAWQLSLQHGKAKWQKLWSTGSDGGEAPDPRRAAAGALFTIPNSASKQLLIHGGRLEAGHILEDLWQATLGTGNVTYQQLWPPLRDSVDNKKHPRGPAARKGHSAIAIQENDPCMVVFGGRNGIGYFNDVWAFRLSTGVWEEWTPTDGNAASPMGRDHFGAVYDAGHMYIFGGRGGSSYGKSQPLGDLWRFTIASRTWTELNATGSTPMARFLFSSDLFYPVLHQNENLKQDSDLSMEADLGWLGYSEEPSTDLAQSSSIPFARSNCDEATKASLPDLAGLVSEAAQSKMQSAAPSQGDNGPAGFMVIFGGETVNECYLNDVWVLHLNSLRWKQLSKPVACQKRCRSIVEARS
ncbi:TPA: hypothetical protein ACH3X2_010076 [Trebouxia sp. C0005]